jgi:autotransporter translocation and assembly factor TamB
MNKFIFIVILLGISIFAFACSGGNSASSGKTVKTGTVNNLNVTLATESGVIKDGANDFTLTFTDAAGKPVDVGAVSVNFHMPAMGTMPVMNDSATLTTSGTPGIYKGKVKLQMAGEWQTQIAYEGAVGKGKTVLPIVAQ